MNVQMILLYLKDFKYFFNESINQNIRAKKCRTINTFVGE
jgi:hypothetical protein